MRACLYEYGVLFLPVNTTDSTMDQPVSHKAEWPVPTECTTGELPGPIPPDEYYAKRLLQQQTLKNKIDLPEHIQKQSIEFRQFNGTPHSYEDFLALVTAHETWRASVNHPIVQAVPTSCPSCSARFHAGSEIFHKAPKCNALHLTSLVEQFYSLPLPDYRREAFGEFKALLFADSETSLLGRLGAQNARSVSPTEYVYLLGILSDMFFPIWGKRMMFDFDFIPESKTLLGHYTAGICQRFIKTQRSLIKLAPWIPKIIQNDLTAPTVGAMNKVSRYRLGILLHEICHAFLWVHTCNRCPEHVAEVAQMKGHGFAWHRIALMVELEAWSQMGMHLCLERHTAIETNWEDLRVWPSILEAENWKLKTGSFRVKNGNAICRS